MGVRIRLLRERLRPAGLPWPVLVAVGAAAAAVFWASHATTAEAAGLGIAPAPAVGQAGRQVGPLPVVSNALGGLLAREGTPTAAANPPAAAARPATHPAAAAAAQPVHGPASTLAP